MWTVVAIRGPLDVRHRLVIARCEAGLLWLFSHCMFLVFVEGPLHLVPRVVAGIGERCVRLLVLLDERVCLIELALQHLYLSVLQIRICV